MFLHIRFWISLCAVLAIAAWSYAPGLDGGFLFDDFANLPALGAMGPVDNAAGFWRYITSGTADPTGRPLALLSFLVDAQNWPADPLPFKRSNVALHLINIALLTTLLLKLTRLAPGPQRDGGAWIAVASAAVWGLHPLMVSTTLYVVQREAMLPATFVLLGLLCWLHGRSCLAREQARTGAIWMVAGTALCTALATLSKANGVLLPLLIGVLELTVLCAWRPIPIALQRLHTQLCLALVAIPAALILSYLLWTGLSLGTADLSGTRPWTVGERLMTQPRVLVDYLTKLIVPRPYTAGLFNDAYVVSTGLLQPLSTLPALAIVLALPAWALWQRRRYPILAAAVLFYFAGQLLESTSIPLELYFEHRNYLPAMLLGWPLCVAISRLRLATDEPGSGQKRQSLLAVALICILLAGLAAMTHARARLWGDPLQQALVWGAMNPASGRAQAYAALAEIRIGQHGKAIERLEKAAANAPSDLQLALTLLNTYCAMGRMPASALDQAEAAFRTTGNPGGLIVGWTEAAITDAAARRCRGLDMAAIERLLKAGEGNPLLRKTRGRVQDILHLRGLIALEAGRTNEAAALFSAALLKNPKPELALKQAALLGSRGAPALALAQLDEWTTIEPRTAQAEAGMPAIHDWVLAKQRYWPAEIAQMREALLDAQAAAHPAPHTTEKALEK